MSDDNIDSKSSRLTTQENFDKEEMESIKKFTRSIEDVVSGRSQIDDVRISMDRGTNATGSMINSDDVSLIDAS